MKSVDEKRTDVRSLIDIRYVIKSMSHFGPKKLEPSLEFLSVLRREGKRGSRGNMTEKPLTVFETFLFWPVVVKK
jgi:hypothetical protein